jgi:AcrR family transcriptional regulator
VKARALETHARQPRREAPVGKSGPDLRTRERVLEAATRQFAESGFKRVTVRAICLEAKANVAAVNYHFRDKLGLYKEVLGRGVALMSGATDEAARAIEGLSPKEQLRAYVRVVTQRIYESGANSWLSQLINREVTDPTPMVSTLVEEGIRPRLELLGQIVGQLMHRPSDDRLVMICVNSIHAQIVMFKPSPLAERVRISLNLPKMTPEAVADHVVTFSLGGMEALASANVSACADPLPPSR